MVGGRLLYYIVLKEIALISSYENITRVALIALRLITIILRVSEPTLEISSCLKRQ